MTFLQLMAFMYTLLEFGGGRKLERIAGRLVNRPCPAAENARLKGADWPVADATFHLGKNHLGDWDLRGDWNEPWGYCDFFGSLKLSLTPFGHIGFFPEQRMNWDWLRQHRDRLAGKRVLNLFAFTGGTTLALARMGAAVTHVDSAGNMVERARENAAISGLGEYPVRWIVEDARKFAERELRRGNQYDGVVLDPPTWGHGVSRGQRWEIERDLPELLAVLGRLAPACKFLLLTCHTAGYPSETLRSMIEQNISIPPNCFPEAGSMFLNTPDGRKLESGEFVRWLAGGRQDFLPEPQSGVHTSEAGGGWRS